MAVRKRRADGGTQTEAGDGIVDMPILPRRLSVSEILRERRVECGLDVEHVAQVLRIRSGILTAIETSQFDQMPGPAYAVGFVRSYATYLGLDSEALVLRFKAEVAEVARRPNLHFPLPVNDSRVPTRPILLICLLLAAVTYAGWYFVSTDRHDLADLVPAVPERLKHLLGPEQVKQEVAAGADHAAAPASVPQPATESAPVTPQPATPAAPGAQPPAGAAPASTAATPAAGTSATAPSVAAANPPAASAPPAPETDGVPPVEDRPNTAAPVAAPPPSPDLAQPAVSESGKAAGQTSYGAPEGQARIILRAAADSWIQVRDSTGSLLITRVLKPGESYNVPNQPGLSLVTGNAGGLDIVIDGKTIPRIGESGRVARNVALDPERLLAGRTHAN